MEKYLTRSLSNSSLSNKRPAEDPVSPNQWRKPKKFVANPMEGAKGKETATTNNSFKSLPLDADEENLESFNKASKKKMANNTPPIIIEVQGNWNFQTIRDVLMKYNKDFHLQYRGRKLVRVQCYSAKIHQMLKDGLLSENIAFHTFTRKDEKRPKAVLKGLPKFLHSDITAELESLGFTGATATELKTMHPTECPPVLVQLPSGTNMVKFKNIKYILNCVVNIERYKPTKKPGTQCFRCQGFGHASRNCNRPARCVKCALNHPTWECPKKDRSEPALCCNCQKEHPANYSHCDERLKYLERIESKRETLRKTIASKVTCDPTTSQNTWARIASSKNNKIQKSQVPTPQHTAPARLEVDIHPKQGCTSNKPQSTSTLADVTQTQPIPVSRVADGITLHDFETAEMLEILTTIQSIKKEFTKCKTFMEKVILILNYLGHYV